MGIFRRCKHIHTVDEQYAVGTISNHGSRASFDFEYGQPVQGWNTRTRCTDCGKVVG